MLSTAVAAQTSSQSRMQHAALLATCNKGCRCNKDSFGKLAVQDEGSHN